MAHGASESVKLRLVAVALPEEAMVEELESLRVRVSKGERFECLKREKTGSKQGELG